MKRSVIAAAIAATLVTGPTFGQTAIQAGLWEVTDKTTLEGMQPMPATSKRVCVKGGEAILERLLYPTPDDFAKHGCTFSPGPKQPGIFKATTVCPPIDTTASRPTSAIAPGRPAPTSRPRDGTTGPWRRTSPCATPATSSAPGATATATRSVATGRIEAMVDPEVALWDVAPMPVILNEAGGRFTDFVGRCRPVERFRGGDQRTPARRAAGVARRVTDLEGCSHAQRRGALRRVWRTIRRASPPRRPTAWARRSRGAPSGAWRRSCRTSVSVHRWATALLVADPPENFGPSGFGLQAKGPAILDEFSAAGAAAIEELRRRPLTDPVFAWGHERTRHFWLRRLANETAVHRADADEAAGRPMAIDPGLAADGVDEYFTEFFPLLGPNPLQLADGDPSRTVHVHCTDVEGEWLLTFAPDAVTCSASTPRARWRPVARRPTSCWRSGAAGGPAGPGSRCWATEALLDQVDRGGEHLLVRPSNRPAAADTVGAMTDTVRSRATTSAGESYAELIDGLRAAFDRGHTRSMAWRRSQLEAMLRMIDEQRGRVRPGHPRRPRPARARGVRHRRRRDPRSRSSTRSSTWSHGPSPAGCRCPSRCSRPRAGHPRAARRGAGHRAVELPGAAPAQPDGRRHRGRQLRRGQAARAVARDLGGARPPHRQVPRRPGGGGGRGRGAARPPRCSSSASTTSSSPAAPTSAGSSWRPPPST